jgi:hypothetical protein
VPEVTLPENDEVIQALGSDRFHETLRVRIAIRTLRRNRHALHPARLQDKGNFTQHVIVGQPGDMNAGGIPSFSQPHALFLTDVDGDGLKDIITGKSFYAHAPGVGTDPDVTGTPVFYVFKLVRDAHGVSWEPHLVDSEVGLGRQLTATDLNGDGLVDIAVASKHGVFLFFQQ